MEASHAASKPRHRASLRQLALLARPADRTFEQLYKRHAREVYQYALAVLANPADAEDVTQTTFLNAYRAFQRGERPRKPHNWLIAIAHNVCRMRWRQAGARPREVALDEAPEPASPNDEAPNLDEVLNALAGLSFNQRAALVMRELEGRSYQEIAQTLDVTVSAVEALLFRARRRLRLHREALGVISAAPLPGSLASFFGAGGAAVAVGGTAVGADLVLKAAAVVAAGAVTAGVGYKSVEAVAGSAPAPQRAAQARPMVAKPARPAPVLARGQRAAKPVATKRQRLRRAVETRVSRSRPTLIAEPTLGAPAASPSSSSAGLGAVAPGVAPPPPPVLPALPPPPAVVPPPPAIVPPPVLPITVTIPTLPPPPIK